MKKAAKAKVVKRLVAPLKKRIDAAYREIASPRTAYGAQDQTRRREFPAHAYDWTGSDTEEALALLRESLVIGRGPRTSWNARALDFIYRMSR